MLRQIQTDLGLGSKGSTWEQKPESKTPGYWPAACSLQNGRRLWSCSLEPSELYPRRQVGRLACLSQDSAASPEPEEEIRAQETGIDIPGLLRWLWISAATFVKVSQSPPPMLEDILKPRSRGHKQQSRGSQESPCFSQCRLWPDSDNYQLHFKTGK